MNSLSEIASGQKVVPFEVNIDFSLKILFGADFGMKDLDLLVRLCFILVTTFEPTNIEPQETLSTGVFGRTRLVRSLRDKHFYALKIMKKARIVKQGQLQHVQNEIKIMSRLRCNFVVELRAVFQDESSVYMMMDYIPGGELFSHLRRDKRFQLPVAQFFAVEIACALHHMHKCFVLYRDLKPENILINKIGHIRLTDLSLAKVIQDRTFTLCGTPEYLAPEIIQGLGYGFSSDWWSLGILLHEMIVGYPPFFGRNPFIVYRKILQNNITFDDAVVQKPTKAAITAFLSSDRLQRLGSSNFEQVKSHAFFKGVDWNSAFRELLVPPMVPTVLSEGDSSNFDFYPEEALEEPANMTNEERNLFYTIDEILDRPKQM
jgi:serine/threonine protein kinase